jgi:hypothetical protein
LHPIAITTEVPYESCVQQTKTKKNNSPRERLESKPAVPWVKAHDMESARSPFQLPKKKNWYKGTSRNIKAVAKAFMVEFPGVMDVVLNKCDFVS